MLPIMLKWQCIMEEDAGDEMLNDPLAAAHVLK